MTVSSLSCQPASAVQAGSTFLESFAPPDGTVAGSKDIVGRGLEAGLSSKAEARAYSGKAASLFNYQLYSGEAPHPVMSQALVTEPQNIPHEPITFDNLRIKWSNRAENIVSASADLHKAKKAFLGIKYSKSLVHAFTVFTFEEGGLSLPPQFQDRALAVTLHTRLCGDKACIGWTVIPLSEYMKVALLEGKDTILFYPYDLPREAVAMMFFNALAISRQKDSDPEIFGLLDNNCIVNSLQIPNSLLPPEKQLRGCLPQLTARDLQRKGIVGSPVKVEGADLLTLDFDKLFPGI